MGKTKLLSIALASIVIGCTNEETLLPEDGGKNVESPVEKQMTDRERAITKYVRANRTLTRSSDPLPVPYVLDGDIGYPGVLWRGLTNTVSPA